MKYCADFRCKRRLRYLFSASGAKNIGMALHELASNVGEYGALSDDSGCVDVGWSLEPKEGGRESFMISWHERSGPAITAPSRVGFGSIIL